MTDFREITTSDSLDNIFNDIAREANITIKEAKRNIEIHGSSPILLVRNYLLGNDYTQPSTDSCRLTVLSRPEFLGF